MNVSRDMEILDMIDVIHITNALLKIDVIFGWRVHFSVSFVIDMKFNDNVLIEITNKITTKGVIKKEV